MARLVPPRQAAEDQGAGRVRNGGQEPRLHARGTARRAAPPSPREELGARKRAPRCTGAQPAGSSKARQH
eukprot:7411460-Lingulodinium_polyedra.AAC.1